MKDKPDVQFNAAMLREIRLKDGVSVPGFAELLDVSEDYIYRLESGLRNPGLKFLLRLSRYSGFPMDAFFEGYGEDDGGLPETPGRPGGIKNPTDLIRSLKQERHVRKTMERNVTELERMCEHFMAACELNASFTKILMTELPKPEQTKKIAALARKAAREDELRFDEIQAILRVDRTTLRRWLEEETVSYHCKLFPEKAIIACTPGAAGMMLACFDCEERDKGDCRGYGEDNYPENIFVLIALLKANGIYNRTEQSQVLRESHGIELTPHQISELLSRKRHGKSVPEDVENMDIRRRLR
ncbi:MAG: helix-turn-helix domain-containing protein [Synergistaceae bacterium]|jgi:transcriptional regulator with XRE-family HTH domain|nr:helix-turn-helix domain-containing protein [Synergistaceae bacterium]